jgi:hypothetical protein
MPAHDGRLLLRRSLLSGTGACALVACYSLWRYPGILVPPRPAAITGGLFAVVLVVYWGVTIYSTRGKRGDVHRGAHLGLVWGILIASFWSVEVAAGNLADPQTFGLAALYFGAAGLAFLSPLFAGIAGARRSGRILAGSLVGLWSGLVSGVLTFLIIMAVTYVFLDSLLLDPQNQTDFQRSGAPDIVAFVVGDSLAGATGHLIIGAILGPSLGTVGGVLGKSLARRA